MTPPTAADVTLLVPSALSLLTDTLDGDAGDSEDGDRGGERPNDRRVWAWVACVAAVSRTPLRGSLALGPVGPSLTRP